MQEIIKIPSDFHALSNVNVLYDTAEFIDHIKESINSYSSAFIESFLMTTSEVCEYIPERDHNKYKITFYDHVFNFKDDYSLSDKLHFISRLNTLKTFFVDTKNKIINIGWFDIKVKAYLTSVIPINDGDLSYYHFKGFDEKYTFDYDKENRQVILRNFAYVERRNGYGNKYNSNSSYHLMELERGLNNRIEHHKIIITNKFCVQTNQYLGCETDTEFQFYVDNRY